MVSLTSMWAIFLRHIRMWLRDPNYLFAALYWPLLDIFVWGYVGSWIQQASNFQNYEIIALLGVLLWQIIGRGCNIMVYTFSEELWSNNLINFFTLPLRIWDWIGGMIMLTICMTTVISIFSLSAIYILYSVSLSKLVSTFLIFALPLFISALWVGFSCLTVVVTLGKRSTEFAFVMLWSLLPFSGAYYPINVLPIWAQKVSALLPISYLFQGMREYLINHNDPANYLITGYVMSILYTIIAVIAFIYSFNRSKKQGLARLTD